MLGCHVVAQFAPHFGQCLHEVKHCTGMTTFSLLVYHTKLVLGISQAIALNAKGILLVLQDKISYYYKF